MRFLGHLLLGRGQATPVRTSMAHNITAGYHALVRFARKASGAEDRADTRAMLQAGLSELEAQRQWYASERQWQCWQSLWKVEESEKAVPSSYMGSAPPCGLEFEQELGPIWGLKEEEEEECKVWSPSLKTLAGSHLGLFVIEEGDEEE